MRFDLVTIFPDALSGPLDRGVIGQARSAGLIEVRVHDLRDHADPPHRRVDDAPYGGGAGMVFRYEPIARAVAALRRPDLRAAVVRTAPGGEPFDQGLARELAEYEQVVVLSDRYEGADERVASLVTHELSLGDFVLTGGEIVALAVVEAVARLVPGVVGREESVRQDSFAAGWLDHAHFTRPAAGPAGAVPAALRGGDHGAAAAWRRRDGLRRTLERRPDLLYGLPLAALERAALETERRALAGSAAMPRRD